MFAVPPVLPDRCSANEPVGGVLHGVLLSLQGFLSPSLGGQKVQAMMMLTKMDGVCLACVDVFCSFYMMPFTYGPGRTLQVFGALGKYNCTYSTGFKTLLEIQLLGKGDHPAVAQYHRKSCKNNSGLLILFLLS